MLLGQMTQEPFPVATAGHSWLAGHAQPWLALHAMGCRPWQATMPSHGWACAPWVAGHGRPLLAGWPCPAMAGPACHGLQAMAGYSWLAGHAFIGAISLIGARSLIGAVSLIRPTFSPQEEYKIDPKSLWQAIAGWLAMPSHGWACILNRMR